MPSNRSSNAAKKKRSQSTGGRQASRGSAAKRQSARGAEPLLTTTQSDIVGVVLAVLAVAMFVSVVAPTSAVVTSAVGNALELGFGTGAILVPIALFVFAMTFFTADDGPISGRVAAGLALIVLAVLAMISLNTPVASSVPDMLLDAETARQAGGFVGGAIACLLAVYLGIIVGNVILVGVILGGVVVCGFSITEAVSNASIRLGAAKEAAHVRAEERAAERAVTREATMAKAVEKREAAAARRAQATQASLFDETGEAETTFIGDRKTSVLKRGGRAALLSSQIDEPVEVITSDDAPTALLTDDGWEADEAPVRKPARKASKRSKSKKSDEADQGAQEQLPVETPFDEPAGQDSDEKAMGTVPDFLAKTGARGSKADVPAAPAELSRPGDSDESYQLPPLDILRKNDAFNGSYANDDDLAATAQKLQGTLEEFGLKSRVSGWIAGPSVTTFKISMGEGERVNKIVNLEDDIALSLAAKSVRIFAPIPGTSLVGIEIPNDKPQPVFLSDVLPFAQGGPLDCAFGRDSEGKPIVVDLAGLPHLLVAGTTGSGKSVLLNAIIMSMLMRATPEQVRLIMVDPKRVEFTGYAGLPHLYVPVVTEPRQAASALQWGVTEMERRLKVFEHYKVRDIKTYNGNVDGDKYADMENPPKHMPYFVIVIDELADLMMVAGKDVESSIVRIAQLGRAAGIHLIVATQRPSADVVTGLIRANIDNRVALSVDNSLNSRIILDQKGAEQLLGKGDMLVKLRGKKPRRAQGCWVSDEEIEQTVKFVREQVTADYHEDILTAVVPNAPGAPAGPDTAKEDDPLVWQAAQIVVESQLGSTSGLQRALAVGYARAGRIMDTLEAKGVVGPANGSKPREVLLDKEGLEDLKVAEAQYREVE